MTKKKYKFFHDPGHGWLQVPITEIKKLGLSDRISGYSYIHKGMVYLEEDCDAGKFVRAVGRENIEIEEIYQEDTPIRDYLHYPGER